MEEKREITFPPQINKNSSKIATAKNKPVAHSSSYTTLKKKPAEPLLPTKERKELEEAQECTFQPKLVAKASARKAPQKKEQIF